MELHLFNKKLNFYITRLKYKAVTRLFRDSRHNFPQSIIGGFSILGIQFLVSITPNTKNRIHYRKYPF